MIDYTNQLMDILESARVKISDLRPSEWAEQNIIMGQPFPGPLSYSKTPYCREIIDCFAPDHPAREIAVMGSAQWGKSGAIITPVIGYIIANDPGNIIMTVGHEDLLPEAMAKIDFMLDTTGLRKLIKSSAQRAKSQKTGDTNTRKEFPNGFLKMSSASNPKIWRQESYKFGLIDDYEAVKSSSKVAGSTKALIDKRFTVYHTTKKVLYVSSPELEQASNILEVYKMGDQRKFLVPCPCCGVFIELKWSIPGKGGEPAGITWRLDDENKLDLDTVGYICQECGKFFTDQNKSDFVTKGYWQATAKPFKPNFYSYHMSGLYSPPGMTDWAGYVYNYLEAHPVGLPRNESKYQTFVNIDLGEPYISTGEDLKEVELQKNIRNYDIATVPEKLSIADGNGKIVLITCACDLNGKLDDARLDYEVVAWSETGSSYSISHGSIGTFIPYESNKKNKAVREKWTYENHRPNNVWTELDNLLGSFWITDTGRRMKIFITGIDTGYCELQAFTYIDKSNYHVVGLKGDKEDKYVRIGVELPNFKRGQSRHNLYMLRVGQIKDDLADRMRLKWDHSNDPIQPSGFLNFPIPSGGKYLLENYFSHFQSEERVLDKDSNFIWRKKSDHLQNHLFDCRVYNMALKEILIFLIGKELKKDKFSWKEYVDMVMKRA